MIVALLLLVTLNVQSFGSPQNEERGRCGQTVAEQTPLLREAIDNRYTLRRIEFTGNETIRDYALRRRVVLREGDFFSQRNLVKSLASLNKLKQLYPLTMKDVIIQLDKPDKIVDITLCFRERHARPKRASLSNRCTRAGSAGLLSTTCAYRSCVRPRELRRSMSSL
jgi:hypothetical protein